MRFSRLVGIAALATAPALLHAQASSSSDRMLGLGVSGGASLPIGDLSDFADVGFTIAGHVYLMPAGLKTINFRGDVSYDRWSIKGTGAEAVDGHSSVLGITANALVKLSSTGMVHPYLVGGGGAYMGKNSETVGGETVSDNSDTKPGLQIGGGLDFGLSGFSTFVEAKFVNVFSDNSSTRYVPITFGIRF